MIHAHTIASLTVLGLVGCQSLPISAPTPNNEVFSVNDWVEACDPDDPWNKPGPPFRIYGNSYYVGTCGITAILITRSDGHILIDGGPRDGGPLIAANIETLGFSLVDVEFLSHTQEHFDHIGGLAHLQSVTGAEVVASRRAAPVLETGMISADDPQFGMHDPFAPVQVSRVISDSESLSLGSIALTALETPGHAPGALSWSWEECENDQCLNIAYFDTMTAISQDDYRFSDHPDYVDAFYTSLDKIRQMPCDIAITPHPAMSALFERVEEGSGLIDHRECRLYIDDITQMLNDRLAREATSEES